MESAEGAAPASGAAAANAEGQGWRSQLQPEARGRIVNRILEMLKRHLPVSVPEGLSDLRKIAVRFEEKMYSVAISQTDYLRKISLKMLSMDSQSKTNSQQNPQDAQVVHSQQNPQDAQVVHSQQNPRDAQVVHSQQNPQDAQVVQNQRPCYRASSGPASRTGDLKEELCQMNKTLKDQYLEGLGDLYKISMMLNGDNHTPTQKPTNLHEEVNFKSILERSLHSVQINKKPSLEESIPMYKRQIISILNSEEWTPEQTFQQAAGQAPSSSSSRIRPAHGMLSPERSNGKS